MSSYVYDPLSPGSIRLLRLLPSQDEQASIHCHLFPYPLSTSRTGTHLYEALSYYWGSPEKIHTITVGNGSLQITRNLHTALQSLRDCYIERIIWIDAVCINQDDAEEKGPQVQLMAEIYAKASRVVVWLENTTGDLEIDNEAYNDSAQALETIGSFAIRSQNENAYEEVENRSQDDESQYESVDEESQNESVDEESQNESVDEEVQSGSDDEEVRNQAVAKLLGRAWFRRIWVLQEVAAARHILIKCHLAEIDGYAFCLGLEKVGEVLTDQETHTRVRSTLYLIREAAIRPKRVDSTPARFSLQIWPLMNLVEMYSVREATDSRDKLYALLGMSTDMPTSIVPDYRISWADLFSRFVKTTLPDCMSVVTWDESNIAVIRSKGYVVGRVRRTLIKNNWSTQQAVEVDICLSGSKARHTWHLQAAAKSVQQNDVICFLQGTSLPTIIRVHEDYCDIIAIAVNATFYKKRDHNATPLRELLSQETDNPAEFLMVWNWDASSGETKKKLSFESFMIQNGLHCSAPCKSDRLMNVGLLYRALESKKEAILRFSSIAKLYEDSSQRDHPTSLAAVDALLEIYNADESIADESIADEDKVEALELMANVLHRREGFDVMNEDLISRIASNPVAEVMKLVLHIHAKQITITESVLVAAAANEKNGKEIMEVLLDFQGDEVIISENILTTAAANLELGKAIIKVCLERKKDQIVITERVVEAASTETTFFLLGLEHWGFPSSRNIYYLRPSGSETHSYKPDIHPRDILRLMASFLKRQTGTIIIDGRLIIHLLFNADSQPRISNWGMTSHGKGENMEVTPHHIEVMPHEAGVLAIMLECEGDRVFIDPGAVEAMAKIGPDKEESLRKLGKKLLRELT